MAVAVTDVYEFDGEFQKWIVVDKNPATIEITHQAGGYVAAVAGDIGRYVLGGVTGDTGVLVDYDNGNRIWNVISQDSTDLFQVAEVVSVINGTGSGTTTSLDRGVAGEIGLNALLNDGTATYRKYGAGLTAWERQDENKEHISVDGNIWIPAFENYPTDDVWTVVNDATTGNVPVLRRPPAGIDSKCTTPVKLPARTTATRGRMITSWDTIYEVFVSPTNFLSIGYLVTVPANGLTITKATYAGNLVAHYDVTHQPTAHKVSVNNHTLTVTPPTPVYLGDRQAFYIEPTVYAIVTPLAEVDLVGTRVNYTEILVP